MKSLGRWFVLTLALSAMPVVLARSLVLIEAPSPLGLRPPSPGHIPGVRLMPQVLRESGLASEIASARRVTLPEPPYTFEPETETGVRNLHELVRFSRRVAAEVGTALENGETPVLIGGDCSVLLAPALALRQRGRYSLVHVDAHNDFGHERNIGRPYASIAGADLAVVTGRGPPALTDLDGLRPYFRDGDVLQLGEHLDPDSTQYFAKDFPRTAIRRFPLSAVRRNGLAATLQEISERLTRAPTDGFWLHVDLDVLDAALMPATDSPGSPGFNWDDLEATLLTLTRHPKFVGMNVGIYDPELDPKREYAARITAVLNRCLRSLTEPPSALKP